MTLTAVLVVLIAALAALMITLFGRSLRRRLQVNGRRVWLWIRFSTSLLLAPMLAVALLTVSSPGTPVVGPKKAAAAVPPSGSATDVNIGSGAYIIDMGQPTQTIANSLRPYGMVYDLMVNHQIPVLWAISNTKARDGVDFTAGGKDYSGGSFVIAPQYASEAAATVATWRAQGVVVDGPLSAGFTMPQYAELTSWPRIVVNTQNSDLATQYYANSGIPSSAYRFGLPDVLTPCDDLFVMPHADPTFATHQNLIPYNNAGGAIWAGCHAVSVLENLPSAAAPQMNFLSTNGLVPFGNHSDPTPPFQYSDPSNPIMQFKGSLDGATQNGSERVY
ncbi:MAG: hypothetical protein J2P23_13000, partial [Microlunatus sp.]|nr:hypothetical protein [Microlunatus sp.]